MCVYVSVCVHVCVCDCVCVKGSRAPCRKRVHDWGEGEGVCSRGKQGGAGVEGGNVNSTNIFIFYVCVACYNWARREGGGSENGKCVSNLH